MDELAQRFATDRPHLEAVAYRMLGSRVEADDAVQEAWMRLARNGADGVQNLRGWLTTVVARVCLDMLRSRTSRREELVADEIERAAADPGPESEVVLADSVGAALLVVLDTLAPAERLAFVLHDLFAVPFDEIAEIVGRTPTATRQLASRARRRVQGVGDEGAAGDDQSRRREVVAAFLAASRGGDFAALVALLDPDAVLRRTPRPSPQGRSPRSAGPRRWQARSPAGPCGAPRPHRRRTRSRLVPPRCSAGGVRLHRRRRDGHRHRADQRPRPPGAARGRARLINGVEPAA